MRKTFNNDIMRKQLEQIVNIPQIEISNEKLQKLLLSEVIEWDGCILLEVVNDLKDLGTHFKPNEYYQDRTGYEAFCNHIHVND